VCLAIAIHPPVRLSSPSRFSNLRLSLTIRREAELEPVEQLQSPKSSLQPCKMRFFTSLVGLLWCAQYISVSFVTAAGAPQFGVAVDALVPLSPLQTQTVQSVALAAAAKYYQGAPQVIASGPGAGSNQTQPIPSNGSVRRSLPSSFQCKFSYCQVIGCNLCPRRTLAKSKPPAEGCYPSLPALENSIKDALYAIDPIVYSREAFQVYTFQIPSGKRVWELSSKDAC
jgi:hypothetical protein